MTLTHHGHVMGLVCEYLTPVSQYRLSKNIWSGKHCRGVARGGGLRGLEPPRNLADQ